MLRGMISITLRRIQISTGHDACGGGGGGGGGRSSGLVRSLWGAGGATERTMIGCGDVIVLQFQRLDSQGLLIRGLKGVSRRAARETTAPLQRTALRYGEIWRDLGSLR